jgi:signal peptidase I
MAFKNKRKTGNLLKILAISLISLACLIPAYMFIANANLENPVATSHAISGAQAPHDTIKDSSIEVYPDRIIIHIENASLSAYAPTGSMIPVFNEGANGIRIVPSSSDEIAVGDIVSYAKDGELIIHRVIEKGADDLGIYFIVKGDNNAQPDGKIRFSDIRYKTVAILY